MILEVVVYNIESAIKAQEGGADRIELCSSPGEGGTTPSYGTIHRVKEKVSIDIVVMIRPRGGDFCYSADEFESMKYDIEQCKKLQVKGVVFGILNTDGTLDKERCKTLINLAKPLRATCHRAFDMTRDPFETLEACIEVGFERILTSGQKAKAIDGVALLASLIEKSANRISIMPGSGVNEQNTPGLVSQTGATQLHFSAMTLRNSTMAFKNNQIATMGTAGDSEFTLRSVDPEIVRTIRKLAEEAYPSS